MTQNKATTSKNIKAYREAARLTQESLAGEAEISRNYLALLETGQREPSLRTLQRISGVLGVPVSVLTIEVDATRLDPLDRLLLETYEIAFKSIRKNRKSG